MPPTPSRAGGAATAFSLLLALGGLAAPAAAADNPEAAVNELMDAVEAGDFSALDGLVCEAERDAVRAMLDPGEQMGFGGGELPLTFQIEDRSVEIVAEDGDEATAQLGGTLSMDVDEDEIEDLVRSLLEADMGGEVSDEDFEMMLPFVEMAFSQSLPMDEEVTLVREDGEWVVCGGLGEVPQDDFGLEEANLSSEGVCGLATPEELTAVGLLEYDTSSGFELTSCTYSTSDWEAYHSATVSVGLDTDAEYNASAYGADQEIEVAGARAFASDGGNVPLFVQVGPDMLSVSAWPPEPLPEGYDGLAQSVAIAELFVPRMAESRADLIPPVLPLLCDLAFAGDFEAAIGAPMQSGNVESDYCNFTSRDTLNLNVSLRDGTLDEFLQFYPDSEEMTVAGLPALKIDDEYNESNFDVRVELPGEQVLSVTVEPPAYDKPLNAPSLEVVELLTQHVVDKQAE
jgi:hypothetical protein